MTLRLSDEEREIVLRTLKARLDALHTEMTQTDSPEFNIQLKHEEQIIEALIERLDSGTPEAPGEDRSQGRTKPNGESATATGPPWPEREGATATEFTVILEDKPGTLARLGIVLGDAMVNIEAIHGTSREKRAIVQFVPNDQGKATRALDAAGIAHSTREVLIVRALDEPGTLGDVALVVSQAGINIDSVYVTTPGHVVLGVDDLVGATHVASSMAVVTPE
jgi:hypothetical protein